MAAMTPARPPEPTSLLINGIHWRIAYVKSISLSTDRKKPAIYEGDTECDHSTIRIREGQDEEDLYDTILHEAQHAMTCKHGLVHNERFNNLQIPAQIEDDYHSGIYWATPMWIRFIQDNPEFIRRVIELKPPLAPDDPPPYF